MKLHLEILLIHIIGISVLTKAENYRATLGQSDTDSYFLNAF